MYNFFKECVKKYKIINPYIPNLPSHFPCITMTVNEGANGISTGGGYRVVDFLASFTSWAKGEDYITAWEEINKLKNNLLITDVAEFEKKGYNIDIINVNAIKDTSYTSDNQRVFRFNFNIKVNYKKVVI